MYRPYITPRTFDAHLRHIRNGIKVKRSCIAVNGTLSHSYGTSLATVLPANRHKWTRPALTPAMQAGTRFTYLGGMEGWVDLVRHGRELNQQPFDHESDAEPLQNQDKVVLGCMGVS